MGERQRTSNTKNSEIQNILDFGNRETEESLEIISECAATHERLQSINKFGKDLRAHYRAIAISDLISDLITTQLGICIGFEFTLKQGKHTHTHLQCKAQGIPTHIVTPSLSHCAASWPNATNSSNITLRAPNCVFIARSTFSAISKRAQRRLLRKYGS